MKKKLSLVASWLLVVAMVVVADTSLMAGSQEGEEPLGNPYPGAQFSGYSTGSNIHADVLETGAEGPRIVDAEGGFAGAAVDTGSFGTAGVYNEMGIAVVPDPTANPEALPPDPTDKEAYAQGAGLAVGLVQDLPNDNFHQLVLGGTARAASQPPERNDAEPVANSADTGLVQTDLLAVPGSPLIYAQALEAQAQSVWNEDSCIIGQPISYSRGSVAKAQLIDTASDDTTDDLDAPLVQTFTEFRGLPREASTTTSFTYLRSNGDGTFGLVSETRQTLAPVQLLQTDPLAPGPITIEVVGELFFRSVATGLPDDPATVDIDEGAVVEYGFTPNQAVTPVVNIWLGGDPQTEDPTIQLTTQDLFGPEGFNLKIPPDPGPTLLELTIGEDARAITPLEQDNPDPASQPTEAADGTQASGAADFIRLNVLDADSTEPGAQLLELRLGHMEAEAQVPADGIRCTFPVDKTVDPPVVAPGDPFTYTITIPSDEFALEGTDCDLTSIAVADTVTVAEGDVSFTIDQPEGAEATQNEDGSWTILWPDVGPYSPGDPPIVLTVTGTIDEGSGNGMLRDFVEVVATLGNCQGGAIGEQLVELAAADGTVIDGETVVDGPRVQQEPGETTTTTEPDGETTTTTEPDGETTTTTEPEVAGTTQTTQAPTTTTTRAEVRGVQIARAPTQPARAVNGQPRFTG